MYGRTRTKKKHVSRTRVCSHEQRDSACVPAVLRSLIGAERENFLRVHSVVDNTRRAF